MKQLSGLDASFLYLETDEMPMHVGSLAVYELPAGMRGSFVPVLRRHIASRLHAAPMLRRRLWWMPLNLANPAWVDAEPDLRWHIVRAPIAPRAGRDELEAAVSELHAVRLDRHRPLWRLYVFEGLAPSAQGRRRVAVYTQFHHAAVDGQAAVALANVLLDTTPEPRTIERRPGRRARIYELHMTEMLRGALGNQLAKVAQIVRELPATLGTLKGAAGTAAHRVSDLARGRAAANVTLAPPTAFNHSIGRERRFSGVTLPLREVMALAHAHGCTLNEFVLVLCAGALRRVLARQRVLPRKSLIAAVPITLRQAGDETPDNQASMSLVSLGTHLADPLARIAHVKAASAAMKAAMGSVRSLLPTDFPSLGVPWLMEAAASLYGRAKVADRIPQLANLVISNVPGPLVPLYMAGARALSMQPTSIVVHGVGLNITVQTHGDSLDFGLMAAASACEDVRALADAIGIAWDDLIALPRPGEAAHPDTPPRSTLVGRARAGIEGALRETVDVSRAAVQRTAGAAMRASVGATVGKAVGGTVGKTVGASVQRALDAALGVATPSRKRVRQPARTSDQTSEQTSERTPEPTSSRAAARAVPRASASAPSREPAGAAQGATKTPAKPPAASPAKASGKTAGRPAAERALRRQAVKTTTATKAAKASRATKASGATKTTKARNATKAARTIVARTRAG